MSKLYVLVRKDLSWSQRVVQAGHAIAQHLKDHPGTAWENGTLVVLGVHDLKELIVWRMRAANRLECSFFIEPDMKDEMTAFTAYGESASELFKGMILL